MRTARTTTVLAAVLSLLPALAAAQGAVIAVEGKAAVERGAQRVPVVVALSVQGGDTLTVADQSKVQLQFDDDSVFSIPGAAVLRVDAFELPKQGPGKAVYTLVDGGFRTITGRISKNPKDVYELHTDLAIVTVRGSAYTALRCNTRCKGAKPGLYVKGEQGQITVANDGGKIVVLPGQVAFVEARGIPPARVTASPFNDPIFASAFAFDDVIETGREPDRIEQDLPASPS